MTSDSNSIFSIFGTSQNCATACTGRSTLLREFPRRAHEFLHGRGGQSSRKNGRLRSRIFRTLQKFPRGPPLKFMPVSETKKNSVFCPPKLNPEFNFSVFLICHSLTYQPSVRLNTGVRGPGFGNGGSPKYTPFFRNSNSLSSLSFRDIVLKIDEPPKAYEGFAHEKSHDSYYFRSPAMTSCTKRETRLRGLHSFLNLFPNIDFANSKNSAGVFI